MADRADLAMVDRSHSWLGCPLLDYLLKGGLLTGRLLVDSPLKDRLPRHPLRLASSRRVANLPARAKFLNSRSSEQCCVAAAVGGMDPPLDSVLVVRLTSLYPTNCSLCVCLRVVQKHVVQKRHAAQRHRYPRARLITRITPLETLHLLKMNRY